MKKVIHFLFLLVVFYQTVQAQSPKSEFGVTFNGYVKTDVIFDSRQTANIREGHFLLYPLNEKFDVENVDVNRRANLNILSIQSRITGNITGPEALGAKTRGAIEGEFFGHSDGDINGFRLRHAWIELKWENTALLVGQYWHPMFIVESFPGVVNFNTGAPFQPFSRNPQIRLTQSFGGLNIIATASSQRDFQSTGPDGSSSKYLRNSTLPMLNLQCNFKSGGSLAGIGGDFKTLTPRLVTEKNYEACETVESIAAFAYAKYKADDFTVKAEGVFGENMFDLLMLGGYAVTAKDSVTGALTYAPLPIVSGWAEVMYGKDLEIGIFAGFMKNLGLEKEITGTVYARGNDIDQLIRIAPRIQYTTGSTRFAAEFDYTTAFYGTPDTKAKVQDAKAVTNLRILLAAYYFF